jgi:hypothetical protein
MLTPNPAEFNDLLVSISNPFKTARGHALFESQRMVDHSYGLVVKKLPKADRQFLEMRYSPEALYRA